MTRPRLRSGQADDTSEIGLEQRSDADKGRRCGDGEVRAERRIMWLGRSAAGGQTRRIVGHAVQNCVPVLRMAES